MERKYITPSVYSFENLINDNFLYVDKTEYLWKLVQPNNAMYFLSRPRRFGKSLTISTLEAIFQGKKELFRGLAIYDKPYDWKQYPVIHLDMSQGAASKADGLQDNLNDLLERVAHEHNMELHGSNLNIRFVNLITDLAAGDSKAVILIDEYDKPILDNITNPELPGIFGVLKSFYSAIKSCNANERFVFITGVSKFCHVSLFSDLNNLLDISMNAHYATMLGYTQTEFEQNFAEWIDYTAEKQDLSRDEYLAQIKSWYDGYRFEETAERVYNPVSLAHFFINDGKFRNYWFETGTPTFLMELVQNGNFNFTSILSESISGPTFDAFELDDIDLVTLLYQTGYLTIREIEYKFGQTYFRLDFPNREVSESFNRRILNAYSKRPQREVVNFCLALTEAVIAGNLPNFQKSLEVFFAGIPYDVHRKSEANFQNIFFAIFKLLGFNIHAESRTSDGRIDAVIETDKFIYLFEFKLDKDDSALSQIKEKEYFKPYLLSPKKITLVGASFSTETGKISDWQQEEVFG